MNITLNGEAQEAPNGETVLSLLNRLDIADKRLAIELNEDVLPRSRYEQTHLTEGDKVEIVHAIGGG